MDISMSILVCITSNMLNISKYVIFQSQKIDTRSSFSYQVMLAYNPIVWSNSEKDPFCV